MSKKVPERRTKPCFNCKRAKLRCVYQTTLPCQRCAKSYLECLFDPKSEDTSGVNLPSISNLALPPLSHSYLYAGLSTPLPAPARLNGASHSTGPGTHLSMNHPAPPPGLHPGMMGAPSVNGPPAMIRGPPQTYPMAMASGGGTVGIPHSYPRVDTKVQPRAGVSLVDGGTTIPEARSPTGYPQASSPGFPPPPLFPHPTVPAKREPPDLSEPTLSPKPTGWTEVEAKLDSVTNKMDTLMDVIKAQQDQITRLQSSRKHPRDPSDAGSLTLSAEEQASMDKLFSQFSSIHKKRKPQSNQPADVALEPGLLSLSDAQELFSYFDTHITSQLFGFQIKQYSTRAVILSTWNTCPMLIVAVCYIALIHHPTLALRSPLLLARLNQLALRLMVEQPKQEVAIFDTILALCLSSFWLSEKHMFLGIAVQLAKTIGLSPSHKPRPKRTRTFPGISAVLPERGGATVSHDDKLKLWYLLYILDGHQSLMTHTQPLLQGSGLLSPSLPQKAIEGVKPETRQTPNHGPQFTSERKSELPTQTLFDRRLVSQVEYNQAIHSLFSASPSSLNALLDPAKFGMAAKSNMDLDAWMVKWTLDLHSNSSENVWASKSTLLYYHFAKMYINSPDFHESLPLDLLTTDASTDEDSLMLFESTEPRQLEEHLSLTSARIVVNTVISDKDIQSALRYVPVHIYVMVYYAASFLLSPSEAERQRVMEDPEEQQEHFKSLKAIRLLIKLMELNPPVDEALGKMVVESLQSLFDSRMKDLEAQLATHATSARVEELLSDTDEDAKGKISAWPGSDHGHP